MRKERAMTNGIVRRFASPCILAGLALSLNQGLAQYTQRGSRWAHPPGSTAMPLALPAPGSDPAASSSFKFTLLNFPDTLSTLGFGINSGAASSKTEIVGPIGNNTAGTLPFTGSYLLHYSKSKGTTTEAYRGVNMAGVTQQAASGINDSGEIVGFYADSLGVVHGYLESGGVFTTIDVPFAGATAALAFAINNSGQIAGYWTDATTSHGFMLSGGTYTSLDYPGSLSTVVENINNNGQIVGAYSDTGGVLHGFLLVGGTYTSFDVPGSTLTAAVGINDSGDIVGQYCLTSECATTGAPLQGFLLRGGVYTTIMIPGATQTLAVQINNTGVIVGTYYDSVGSHAYLTSR